MTVGIRKRTADDAASGCDGSRHPASLTSQCRRLRRPPLPPPTLAATGRSARSGDASRPRNASLKEHSQWHPQNYKHGLSQHRSVALKVIGQRISVASILFFPYSLLKQ